MCHRLAVYEGFSEGARELMTRAEEQARARHDDVINTEHILLAVCQLDECNAAKVLNSVGISLHWIRDDINKMCDLGEKHELPEQIVPTESAENALALSRQEAERLAHDEVDTDHILIGLMQEGAGVAAQVLVDKFDLDIDSVRARAAAERSLSEIVEILGPHCRDLTAAARAGKLDPPIGRDQEIARVQQVLSRWNRNYPMLLGEAGIDKAAIVEYVAQAIVRGESSPTLAVKHIIAVDGKTLALAALQNPDVVDTLREAVQRSAGGQIAVFIDDLPAILGAAAFSFLRTAISARSATFIGAGTRPDYTQHIAHDPVLRDQFQVIAVTQASVRDTIEILRSGLRDRYEAHHRVSITDAAIVAAATLTDRYIDDRFLPEKAIDVIDEASARIRTRRSTNASPEIREFDEKIMEARRAKESAINAQEFSAAAELRNQERALIRERAEHEKLWNLRDSDVVIEVDTEQIVTVIAEMTGAPEDELNMALPGAMPPEILPDTITDVDHEYVMLNDKPVEDDADDLLGTAGIADRIASIIQLSRNAAPFVMAVDGGWGIGKSTLLTQIEARLPNKPDVVKLRFNAWTAQGENALESLIKSVLLELDPNIVRRWARKVAKKRHVVGITRVGFAIAARFLGLSRLIDSMWTTLEVDAQARNELREDIQGMLSEWMEHPGKPGNKRTLVVFIDDLDRCSDDVVIHVCEAVKLYLDAPGLIFVIACDLSVLARGVAGPARGGASEGRTYLEKIIQVAYRVPPPHEDVVRRLIGGYGERSGISHLLDATVVDTLSEATGRNPRRIKRIINSFVLEHHLDPAWRRAPLTSHLLITAILLQQVYPSFYSILVDETSGDDPIGNFLDYATVRARASNPPPSDDVWWSVVRRLFQHHNLQQPDRLRFGEAVPIDSIEKLLSPEYVAMARNDQFIELLRGTGPPNTRQALRAHLLSSPLGTKSIGESSSFEMGSASSASGSDADFESFTSPVA